MRAKSRSIVVGVALVAGACSDDDTAATDVTPTPTSALVTNSPPTAVETTKGVTTTSAATTTTTVQATAPPTTQSIEDLKARIAADYVAARERTRALTSDPSLENLRMRASQAATGRALRVLIQYIRGLVERDERVVPGEPPVQVALVEQVEVASIDATSATVTVCIADNSRVVLPAEDSPIGSDVFTGDGALVAERIIDKVRLTKSGWLPAAGQVNVVDRWEGSDSCPAS